MFHGLKWDCLVFYYLNIFMAFYFIYLSFIMLKYFYTSSFIRIVFIINYEWKLNFIKSFGASIKILS